jgi:ribosomal-protein-alanine N-acetyltransferase
MAAIMADLHAACFDEARWDKKQIADSLALVTTKAWGFFGDNRLIGFIIAQMLADQSEILTLCVEPSSRKHGYGQKLVRIVIDSAQAASRIFLEVAADNLAAIKLYEKMGFHREGIRQNYYRRKTGMVDALALTFNVRP